MKDKFLIACFDDEEKMTHAAKKLKDKNFKIVDFYTPFPVHGLDDLLDIKRSRLPYVTFIAAGIGLSLALLFQSWTSAVDWPINVGGKPMLSIPAFIPITFELMVLFGALSTVAAFFYVSKKYPSKKPVSLSKRQLDDIFVIQMEISEKISEALKILNENGVISTEEIAIEDEK